MDESTRSSGSKIKPGLVGLLLAVTLVAGYLGYWIGVKNNSGATDQAVPYVGLQTDGLKLGPESIIRSQQATAVGKVAKVEATGITIVGTDKKIGVFRFAPNVNIYTKTASPSAVAKPSNNINDIKVDDMVLLTMTLMGNEYIVDSVSYLPKSPTVK